MFFSDFRSKCFFIIGIANRKSIAYHTATLLKQFGATLVLSVQNNTIKDKISKLFPDSEILVCDVSKESDFKKLERDLNEKNFKFDGVLHSLAFANFTDKNRAYHETSAQNFKEIEYELKT